MQEIEFVLKIDDMASSLCMLGFKFEASDP